MNGNLLELSSIVYTLTKPDGTKQTILSKTDFHLKKNEIVAIVGKSGSGKSTLLRIMANLILPSKGKRKLNFHDDKHSIGMAMVFQTAALFPWLTVLENVKIGLESMNVPSQQVNNRALEAVDLIGLDGFESAYPRELSGGMKQRVGFARALVVDPVVLLMDEPFSALDIFTVNTLKNDFLKLWESKKTSLQSVVLVTHSIEEAVSMADRIVILAANPGHVVSELLVNIPRPRDTSSEEFHKIVDKLYSLMFAADQKTLTETVVIKKSQNNIKQKLPLISPNQLTGIMDAIIAPPYKGTANLAKLTKHLNISSKIILHAVEALTLLKFASILDGDIKLNTTGKKFINADIDERKKIFAKQLMINVPLASYICRVLLDRPDKRATKNRFLTHLEDFLSPEDSTNAVKTIIIWGRYAEIFSYDDNKKMFTFENPS
jgi:NitT/TauT family transport system ATP-binding protein